MHKDKYRKTRHFILTKECQLRKRYKMTLEEYYSLLNDHQHKCALCSRETDLCIDHDHKTNTIRGILCRTCNMMLGLAKDSEELLQKAREYLQRGEKKDLLTLEKQGKR